MIVGITMAATSHAVGRYQLYSRIRLRQLRHFLTRRLA
jgi:hypothetical protein